MFDSPRLHHILEVIVIEEGRKYDADKLRYDLLPIYPLEEIVAVLTYGARKYDDNNWRKVKPLADRYYAAALRHITAWRRGEKLDSESGKHHLAHAMCCLIFIMEAERDEQMYLLGRGD